MTQKDTGGDIQHGRNGKEFNIGKYFVDGFNPFTNTVYVYNGAVFHCCPCCTEPEDEVPFSRITMAQAYKKYEEKVCYLKKLGYTVEVMWSCEWAALKESRADITDFLETLNLSQPLSVKDAFKGGGTNAFKLHYEVRPGEKIHHIDVTSLYPAVNKHESYPIGHPEIILSNFKSVKEHFSAL